MCIGSFVVLIVIDIVKIFMEHSVSWLTFLLLLYFYPCDKFYGFPMWSSSNSLILSSATLVLRSYVAVRQLYEAVNRSICLQVYVYIHIWQVRGVFYQFGGLIIWVQLRPWWVQMFAYIKCLPCEGTYNRSNISQLRRLNCETTPFLILIAEYNQFQFSSILNKKPTGFRDHLTRRSHRRHRWGS
jgi:hypothetical protein